MRILWHSNAPWAGSGYGVQTDLFTRALLARGHEVIIAANYGLQGAVINAGGIPVLPTGLTEWSDDVLPFDWRHFTPDATVVLFDSWVYPEEMIQQVPLTMWAPVDHNPIPPLVAQKLRAMRHVWAMSRFGEKMMRSAAVDNVGYVPHGVDTVGYAPGDRAEARRRLNVPDSTYLAVSVAANKGFPTRKGLDRLLKAWALFVRERPDSLLYLHTLPLGATGGLDLYNVLETYGLTTKQVVFPDVYLFQRGRYQKEFLNTLYNAADVHVLPSAGEGFGVPIVEAQAAGCPVVVTDFTAMTELGEVGYRIPFDPVDDMIYTLQYSEQAAPAVREIIKGLAWGYEHRGDMALRGRAREFALQYDVQRVTDTYMLPALKQIAEADLDIVARARAMSASGAGMQLIAPAAGGREFNSPAARDARTAERLKLRAEAAIEKKEGAA